jgi:hypothetical protein
MENSRQMLTVRQLRDTLNGIPEDKLDEAVTINWNDSCQSGDAESVTIQDG